MIQFCQLSNNFLRRFLFHLIALENYPNFQILFLQFKFLRLSNNLKSHFNINVNKKNNKFEHFLLIY